MPDLKCQRKVGGSKCGVLASGVFEVTYTNGRKTYMLLCADCAFTKMVNTVSMFVREDDDPVFYKPVECVSLVKSLNTTYDQTKIAHMSGHKHWVESTTMPLHPQSKLVEKLVFSPPTPPSVPAAYIKSLQHHDDGK